MELLVVTFASAGQGREAEVLAQIYLIADTVRNAPGLLSSRFYRNRENHSSYFIFTTWEDDESWYKAQQRHSPRNLLLDAMVIGMLKTPPEQWLMHYLWGYNRPSSKPTLADVHLATIRKNQADFTQQGWLQGLRGQVTRPALSFAFLARGTPEELPVSRDIPLPSMPRTGEPIAQQNPIFLNLFSWANEAEREHFYTHTYYQALATFVRNLGVVRTLALEPM